MNAEPLPKPNRREQQTELVNATPKEIQDRLFFLWGFLGAAEGIQETVEVSKVLDIIAGKMPE